MEKRVRQLNISADEMDKRQSAARRLNRNENHRLRQQYEQFRDNHEIIAVEMNQEMKKIQNELNEIREITGYEQNARGSEEPGNTSKRKRRQKTTKRRKIKAIGTKSRSRLTTDKILVENKVRFDSNEHSSSLLSKRSTAGNNLLRDQVERQNSYTNKSVPQTRRVSRTGLNKKDEKLPQITTTLISDSSSLLELDVDEARVQARKRLLGENEVEEGEEGGQTAENDDDVESYMYVPPDGRKRTVYLVPPLEELLKEARKARYLRIPKRLLKDEEDPERELSIDEIFN